MSSWSLNDVCNTDDIDCQNSQISKPGEIIYGQCYRNAALRRLLKALIGKCARHNCAEGYKCVMIEDKTTCELAYCIGNPNVPNALLNEPFGLSRDLGHGMMYKCIEGMKISGKPFAVCRETGKWKSIFMCEIQCETGWIVFGGHCYYIGPDKKTLEDSETDCQRKGSHLVKIEDASENLWLQNVMIEKNIDKLRIGAHDIVQEGTWRWIYDDTFVDFTNWGNNQPNNYRNQDCAELLKSFSYRWNDVSCTSLLQYVCEK
ncbi:Hypothetical predicted protein [Mytilus galloprovincialis]|uniref:C-type lectin domain-containing protein n=1 Tax=Mytilus galloprovincialis TaxID=29158 RepID=A0A8B6FUF0_MYTGA|nr:Hypothetical predicted protein [Mytilus galloprovincialis]